MWRVGDGSQVRIWGDKWVTSNHTNMIQAPIQILDKEAKVSEIINQEANWWNIRLIEQIFPAETVEQICSISICPRLMPNKLIWTSSTTGLFTVQMLITLRLTDGPSFKEVAQRTPQSTQSGKLSGNCRSLEQSSFFFGGHATIFYQQRRSYSSIKLLTIQVALYADERLSPVVIPYRDVKQHK
jgi:hypothetical protein